MRTPDEIKRELQRCEDGGICCSECRYRTYGDCRSRLRSDAFILIKRLEFSQSKWVDIKEKLPEREKKVLVINGHGCISMLAFWKKESNKWTWLDMSGHFNHVNDITHWMPLPKSPKEVT